MRTEFVKLNTEKCKACWKCIEVCAKNVIGRINFPWHKHAKINNPENCSGCLKCLKICEFSAYELIPKTK
ncbi:MAG: FeS-binding protein [Bacteroidetes bacterium]|nr:FeS-binding protein [Bacteroidota bacterium]